MQNVSIENNEKSQKREEEKARKHKKREGERGDKNWWEVFQKKRKIVIFSVQNNICVSKKALIGERFEGRREREKERIYESGGKQE